MPRKKIRQSVNGNIRNVALYRISSLSEKIKRFFTPVKEKSNTVYKKTTTFIKQRPLGSFFIALGLLFTIIIIGNLLQRQETTETPEPPVKTVQIYNIGETPKTTFQAKIEKSGVVTIIAQTGGVVQRINVTEGDRVGKGQTLIVLSSNYQGGNAPAVQTQIAQTQYQNVLDTFDQQKDLIQKQRDVASKTDENADKMREIQRQSIDETNNLINDNQNLVDDMKQTVDALLAGNPDVTDPAAMQLIYQLQGSINQAQSGINQLTQAQRSTEYQESADNPPAKLSDLQKDITLTQLDIQEKGLALNREITRLQVSLAFINEQTMYPASPFVGTVQRVNVEVGQLVSPGTILATISADDIATTAVLTVPEDISKIILQGEPSELIINAKRVAVTPYHVSTQATDGQLYSVLYAIPDAYQSEFAVNSYIALNVPIAPADVVAKIDPFIPLDAVYQTQEKAYVLVVADGKALMKEIILGNVYGSYVEALRGLSSGDQVIIDRNVVAGERVKIQ